MKPFIPFISTVLLLTGCMNEVKVSEEGTQSSTQKQTKIEENIELSKSQLEIIDKMPEVTPEAALDNISKMYSYGHLVESAITEAPPIPKATDKNGVVKYLSYGFAQFMKGEVGASEFFKEYGVYLDDSYSLSFGDNIDKQIKTLQAVYDAFYLNIPESKIKEVFVSNTIVSKTADNIIVAYRRHKLENGNEQFFEMGFVQNEKKEWLLVDNRLSVNPYAAENINLIENQKTENTNAGSVKEGAD